jgi:hypothetical protein
LGELIGVNPIHVEYLFVMNHEDLFFQAARHTRAHILPHVEIRHYEDFVLLPTSILPCSPTAKACKQKDDDDSLHVLSI